LPPAFATATTFPPRIESPHTPAAAVDAGRSADGVTLPYRGSVFGRYDPRPRRYSTCPPRDAGERRRGPLRQPRFPVLGKRTGCAPESGQRSIPRRGPSNTRSYEPIRAQAVRRARPGDGP